MKMVVPLALLHRLGLASAVVIAALIGDNGSLTECDLRRNKLGKEGWCSIFDALAKSSVSKIRKWELYSPQPYYQGEEIGPEGAKSLAAYLAVKSSVTQVLAF